MIAITRIVMKNVNIASTTALETISPHGKEMGLQFGANVVMPQLTPESVRTEYRLYEGKPMKDTIFESSTGDIEDINKITEIDGRPIGFDEWGDSKHYNRK